MDFTKVPRHLVYKNCNSLEAFINRNDIIAHIVRKMEDIDLLKLSSFEEHALNCLNTAYYICTLIMLEKKPRWRWPDFLEIAYCNEDYHKEKYQAITLSIVIVLLNNYDNTWKEKNKKLINDFIEFVKGRGNIEYLISNNGTINVSENYKYIYDHLSSIPNSNTTLSENEFKPRDIDDASIEITDIANNIEYSVEAILTMKDPSRMKIAAKNIYDRTSEMKYDEVALYFNRLGEELEKYTQPFDTIPPSLNSIINDLPQNTNQDLKTNNVVNTESTPQINQFEEQNNNLRQKNKVGLPLTTAQCSLFCEALARKLNFTFSNKKTDLAPMVKKIFGCGEQSAANKLTSGYNRDDREKVASIFDDLSPDFANFIRTFGKSQ